MLRSVAPARSPGSTRRERRRPNHPAATPPDGNNAQRGHHPAATPSNGETIREETTGHRLPIRSRDDATAAPPVLNGRRRS
ncbi:hypothetical protein FRAAL5263 [Frankia alni ACN14a]|uniref:Uncharacterized protein n=1 Tax=Frankia alni (strain DSM 45986 / CECT 9034 / ACN14a) TaxID=326424 RepID=Q0RF55_FRAAA|nr:hypothetical protein FRAAL5263 [Frankia alni ACN14a]